MNQRLRIATGVGGNELFPTAEEAALAAEKAAIAEREAERAEKEAALARVAELAGLLQSRVHERDERRVLDVDRDEQAIEHFGGDQCIAKPVSAPLGSSPSQAIFLQPALEPVSPRFPALLHGLVSREPQRVLVVPLR
jgi:hypothetical protein